MLKKIVSGGQTGADRGALDAALARGFPCGGYCPAGRRAEDGPIPDRYPLEELAARSYKARTRRNVDFSDATLIVAAEPLTGGTRLTADHAEKTGRPWMVVDPATFASASTRDRLSEWVQENGVEALNVAGPRASSDANSHAGAERIVGWLIDTLTSASRS